MIASAQMLGRLWSERAFYKRQHDESMDALIRQHEQVFWQMGEDNALSVRVDNIIAAVEAMCRPIIQASAKPRQWLTFAHGEGGHE